MWYNVAETGVFLLGIRSFIRKNRWTLLLMLVTGASMTVAGVAFHQDPIRMAPLYVSLVISLMHTRAIRYAHLMGSINVIAYGFVNLYYGLFGGAMSCFFFSCPLQFITFLRWHKNRDGSSTKFRKLTPLGRVLAAATFLSAWGVTMLVLRLMGSSYSIWDSVVTVFDILVAALTLLAFIEHAPLRMLSCILNVGLAIAVLLNEPDYAPYLIYNFYALICVTIGAFSTMSIYKKQCAARAKEGEKYENGMG